KNVYEKLEKNGIEFIAALLGNTQNKKEFIESQTEVPDLTKHALSSDQRVTIMDKLSILSDQLSIKLQQQNELASKRLEVENTVTEFRHFKESYPKLQAESVRFNRNLSSNEILKLWIYFESASKSGKKVGLIRRIINRIKFGIRDKTFYTLPTTEIISICQYKYYQTKINELEQGIQFIEKSLSNFAFESRMKEYTALSMQILKAGLYERYSLNKRKPYTLAQLRRESKDFVKDYPVVMSTTYSLRQSLSDDILYDYVIIDEASQVDLATGALALSCAKRAVIVGDVKQLPNVVDADTKIKTDGIFDSYSLKKPYRYSDHSLLSSVLALLPSVAKALLREHYRCHPKIIEFCNQKFYDNQLTVHSEYTNHRQPLIVYKTVAGNHARDRMNQRQIDIIREEIISNQNLENIDFGIVTPYRNQTFALQEAFRGTSILADTVDKFQGRENKVIILSTVDNEISDFTDNANRLNVAVSRAQEQLILVVNDNDDKKDSNINDLIQYIEYNNFSVVQSELNSIFDLLYQGYQNERDKKIKKSGKVSQYDSENLMYALIKEILSQES